MPLPSCTRIRADDQARRDELLAIGWREIEVLETWSGIAPRVAETIRSELATKGDLEILQQLAMQSFKFDRLHRDPQVPKTEADASKCKWVADALNDPSRVTTVIRIGFDIAGFLIYRSQQSSRGKRMVIDLLAVANKHRKKGLATQLVSQAALAGGFKTVKAGTQAINEPARAFYKSIGMRVTSRQRTFHKP